MTSETDPTPAEAGGARVVELTDPELPDFTPRRPIGRLATPDGVAVGVEYEGDEESLPSADDREAFVRAAMARDAGS